MSSLFKGRAPEGGAMLTTFVGGLRHPEFVDLDDESLKTLVKRELIQMMGIPNFSPDIFEISRHEFAIPQYDISTPHRIAAYDAIEKAYPGLLLGGNGIGGIGMADRIKQGRELAERALYLNSTF
jgi:oxygen-dependent protoporphyrinogen oxidase